METLNEKIQPKRVHFVSLGCPKNLVDTEIMLGTLKNDGFVVVENPEDAETIIVNTCGFIEEAKKESISKILELSELKKSGRLSRLVVAGCLTQRYKGELVKGLPEADLFVGSGEFQNISTIIKNSELGSKQKTFFNLPTYLQEESSPRTNSQLRHRAYLKISEGCKKRCSFCAIPLIRGNLQSRTLKAVVSEAKLLVAGGVRELIVISHDFTDYGWDLRKNNPSDDVTNSTNLLRALSDESGADWIRVLYMYPDGINTELLQLFKERKNLVKYFDMPLQHINSQVLKRMNRRMTREQIEHSLDRIRQEIPDAVIRTQFIVGFPGETEAEFQELKAFVASQKFDRVGCFPYSREEDTKAGEMSDQIDEATKLRRADELMVLQREISQNRHRAYIGKTIRVLVEGISEETELLLQGRHSQQAPDIDGLTYISAGEATVGEIVSVLVTDSHDYDLVGEIVSDENAY
ncbi:MAG: 30S ribosomal protein S12 methylthiotransferase RimO [Bdellovibrionales bacterium]|nr:30S ribosomal protein S12 methylthiotransferase RimO [Bdellovibrionales bacterium]